MGFGPCEVVDIDHEYLRNFSWIAPPNRRRLDTSEVGMNPESRGHCVHNGEFPEDFNRAAFESDLLFGLPKRRIECRIVPGFALATGKSDLSAMNPALGSAYEHDFERLVVAPVNGDENRGVID
jgi:hypothetical protein